MDLNERADELDVLPGYWWRSDLSETQLPGVMRRNTDIGVWTLEVVGSLGRGRENAETHNTVTLFGDTSQGLLTLQSASWAKSRTTHSQPRGRGSQSEIWHAFSVILGGHYYEDQLWADLRFHLPLTWHWFSPTHLEGAKKDADPLADDFFEEFSAELGDDVRVSVWRSQSKFYARDRRERRGTGGYAFASENGFTLHQLEQPILAVENLHHLLYGSPTTPAGYALTPVGDPAPGTTQVYELAARAPLTATPRLPQPYFGTRDIYFADFLPKWVDLHVSAESWPTLGPPPGKQGYLQSEVVEAVNTAEALARSLGLGKSEPTEREQEILEAIEGLPKRTRAKAAKALEMARDTLAERLEALALTLGASSAAWLLGDVHGWATRAGQVRNALSHGYATKGRIEKDPDVLFAILASVRVVQQLAMLRGAGFTNGHTAFHDVELLATADGRPLVRHRDSALGEEISYVQRNQSAWLSP